MTINNLQIKVNMSGKKMMQNGKKGSGEKNTFNKVCLNSFWLCKTMKLIRWWRYVNTNIKTKGLSSMLYIFNEITNRIGISYFKWNAIPN